MKKNYVNKLSRQLCLAMLLVFSVSALGQRPFSSIHTGVNAADAKIIEQGVKTFATDKKVSGTRSNGFDDGNTDHGDSWFGYEYYRYTYPSINIKGEPVTLTALAAMPSKKDKLINNIILGCHITITDNASTPSEYIKTGSIKSDVGMLTMHAQSKSNNLAYNCLVILPDYQGYGNTRNEAHPYLAQEITARQSVDALRYGIELYKASQKHTAQIRDDWKTICVGYSQGGSVAMACQKFMETNSLDKDLHLGGSVCGDGPYDPFATLRTYISQNKVYMPVALALIFKGMIDYNPYMHRYVLTDYFSERFLNTGIFKWIEEKKLGTDKIQDELKKTFTFEKDKMGEYIKVSDVLTPEAFDFLSKKVKGEPTAKAPKFDDLLKAVTINDLTEGWKPQYPIYLFHSKTDEVVPVENAESVYQKLRTDTTPNIIKYTYVSKGGHASNGSTFFFAFFGSSYEELGVRAIAGGEETWNNFKP